MNKFTVLLLALLSAGCSHSLWANDNNQDNYWRENILHYLLFDIAFIALVYLGWICLKLLFKPSRPYRFKYLK